MKEERFLAYHEANRNERFQELVRFKEEHGHCQVPLTPKEKSPLSVWIKRQRNQYKLKEAGRPNTLTPERESRLDALGFIWDAHRVVWEERYQDLCRYHQEHGHVDVPSRDPHLGVWVKSQRRQYQLFQKGKRSSMTAERQELLNRLDFTWKARNED